MLARCRNALIDGVSLVNRSYERHEIQDTDSEDEDDPSRWVVYYKILLCGKQLGKESDFYQAMKDREQHMKVHSSNNLETFLT